MRSQKKLGGGGGGAAFQFIKVCFVTQIKLEVKENAVNYDTFQPSLKNFLKNPLKKFLCMFLKIQLSTNLSYFPQKIYAVT